MTDGVSVVCTPFCGNRGESTFSWAVMAAVFVAVGSLGVSLKTALKAEFKEKCSPGIERKKALK